MGKFGLQSKATEVCQKSSSKNIWMKCIFAPDCKSVQRVLTKGKEYFFSWGARKSSWGRTMKMNCCSLSLMMSRDRKTWLKWNENSFQEKYVSNHPKRHRKANTIKKNTAFQTILWSRACSSGGGAREEKWRQIEQNRSQIEANFPKSASSPGNPMNVGRNLDLANR